MLKTSLKHRAFHWLLAWSCVAGFNQPLISADEQIAPPTGRTNGQVTSLLLSTFSIPLPTTDGETQITVYEVETNKAKSLVYAPPFQIDLAKCHVSSASSTQDTPVDYSIEEFVALVKEGKVSPEAEVTLSLYVRFGDSLAVRRTILQIARNQGKYSFDTSDEQSERKLLEDAMFIRSKCNPVHMRRLQLKLSYAGRSSVSLARDNNPTYSSKHIFQAAVPASLVERMASSAGVECEMTYHPLLVNEQRATAVSGQSVKEAVDHLFKEFGEGGLTVNESSPSVVIDRNVASSIARNSRWAEELTVIGDSTVLMNTVLQLIQRKEVDIFATSESEIESALEKAFNWAKFAEEKGSVQLIEKLGAGETLNENETETLRTKLNANSNSSSGGGGISLGPIALGGGGGGTSATTSARTEQDREFARKFASWLNKGAIGGQMPLPPNLNLVRVDKHALDKQVDQIVEVALRSAPFSAPVTITVNTSDMLNLELVDRFLNTEHRASQLSERTALRKLPDASVDER